MPLSTVKNRSEGLPCLCSSGRKVVCVLYCMVSPQAVLKAHCSPNLLASCVDSLMLSVAPRHAIGPSRTSSHRSPSTRSEECSSRNLVRSSICTEEDQFEAVRSWDGGITRRRGCLTLTRGQPSPCPVSGFCFSVAKCEAHE